MQDMAELDEKPLKYNLAPLRAAVQFTGTIFYVPRLKKRLNNGLLPAQYCHVIKPVA